MRWPFAGRRERLRREASDWIARLNGPQGERERAAFERWYRASPDHAEAYDRLSAIFHMAARARRPDDDRAAVPSGRRRLPPILCAAAAAAACAVLAFILLSARATTPLHEPGRQVAAFVAESEGRRIVLHDGSEVLLAPGSALDVAIHGSARRLRLVRGEGRFTVSHDSRPFVVAADGTEVIARGTRFIVRLNRGQAMVSLIEGRVDVLYPRSPRHAGRRRTASLTPGQQLVVVPEQETSAIGTTSPEPGARQPRPVMLQFDDTPLSVAVQRANRHADPKIRLRDPALGDLRVTGAFLPGDTTGLAQSIAAAFALKIDRAADGTLWLRHSRHGEMAG